MAGRLSWLQTPVAVIAATVCLAAASMALSVETHSALAAAPLLVLLVPVLIYLALTVDPAAVLTAGVVLTPFAGNWQQLGIPGILAPDRILIATTIVMVMVRAATGRGEPLPRLRPVHYVLALAGLWAVGNALVAHTLTQRASLLKIVEAYGAVSVPDLLPRSGHLHDRAQAANAAHCARGARRISRAHHPVRDGRSTRAGVAEVHHGSQLRHPLRPWSRTVRRRRRKRFRPLCVRAGRVCRGRSMARRRPSGGMLGGSALLHRNAADPGTLGVDGRRRRHRSHVGRLRPPEADRAAGDRRAAP